METKDLIHSFLFNQNSCDSEFDPEYDEIEDYEIRCGQLEVSYRGKWSGLVKTDRFNLLEYLTFIYNYKQK